jgi:hypothetical protein
MTNDDENSGPGLGKARKCGSVKQDNGIPTPYDIYHYGFLFHYISANQKLHFQWCQYWMPYLNDPRKLF